jgi:chemotaxis signal transduction protein
MRNNYLLFRLGERIFAVQLLGAIEILPWRRTRFIPLAYSHVEGVMDYRGTLYPVIQVAQVLGLSRPGPIGFTAPDEQPPKGKSIILLQEGKCPFGISVDSVVKMAVLEDPQGEVPAVKGMNMQLVKGVQYEEDQEITIISFERLFHAG